MASTYSPKLKFELIGAGEQAGLWGTTTNKNIGELIEQAIAGVTTVDLTSRSGNYELSSLDGTVDQARSAVISCIGTAAAAVNIIIPTSTKLYVFRNACGFPIVIKTIGQIGGVTLANGEANTVFCDGASAFAGLVTAGSGTTPVGQGGTGVNSFTGGFVVSPAPFGSTALTSISSVNLSTMVSGQLGVANGGTGISTTPAAGQILIGTSGGGYTPGAITGSGGITVTNTSGAINISSSGGGAVTSVNGSGNISVSPTTGSVNVSITTAPTFSSYVTTPRVYYGNSPGNMYVYDNGGEMQFYVGGLPSAKITSAGIGCQALAVALGIDSVAGSIRALGATSAGDQRIGVIGAGYGSGMAPAAYQCGANAFGLTYTPSPARLDILGGSLSAYFSGSSGVQGNNSPNWTTISDQNLKTNLRPINSALDKLNALNPCHFEYKDELGTTRSGFIAQEFETVFPGHVKEMGVADNYKEFVPEGQETIKTLDPNLLPYLVKAIQELSAKVDAQAAEIAALKGAK